ncbi:MAG: hypothetical protein ACT4P1_11525 [Sporichthyaceae bacterium]
MFLLRVVLPDRPGSLGALATALGKAEADIVGVDVVEHRGDGCAVDDILVELPPNRMADALVTACNSVEGAEVEFVRFYPSRGGLQRDLQAVEAMTEDPTAAVAALVRLAPDVFRADWALVLEVLDEGGNLQLLLRSGAAPEDLDDVTVPWLPVPRARRLPEAGSWAPSWAQSTTAAVSLGHPDQILVLGRRGGPAFLDSELARLGHLVSLARAIGADTV